MGKLIVESVFIVLALIVFNLFPQWIGLSFLASVNGGSVRWHTTPLLSPAFFTTYLPWLNALWIGSIGLNLVLLRQGRWQRLTRTVDLALTGCNAFVLYWMLFGPPLLAMEIVGPASLQCLLGSLLPNVINLAPLIGLIATIGEAVHKLYLLVRTWPIAVYRRSSQGSTNHQP